MMHQSKKDLKRFPLKRISERELAKDYEGYVYIWDIDGTYLHTDMSSKISLAKILFKKPSDRTNIPASDILLRHLRIGFDASKSKLSPIYFITGSPPQLKDQITRKMALDRVHYDGIIFKDLLGVLSGFELDELETQITYKLTALLHNRSYMPARSKELLFGDNLEQDSLIYSLYENLISKNSDIELIEKELSKLKIKASYISYILDQSSNIEKASVDPIDTIYIHQTKQKKDTKYSLTQKLYSDKIVPVINFFQASAHLYEHRHISLSGVYEVFRDTLLYRHNKSKDSINFSRENLIKSLHSMLKGNYIQEKTVKEILDVIS